MGAGRGRARRAQGAKASTRMIGSSSAALAAFLAAVQPEDLATQSREYRKLRTVEKKLHELNPIDTIYRLCPDIDDYVAFEVLYEEFLKEQGDTKLRSYFLERWDRGKQELNDDALGDYTPTEKKGIINQAWNVFSRGLQARVWRTWIAVMTQKQLGIVFRKELGRNAVSASIEDDKKGIDLRLHIGGKVGDVTVDLKVDSDGNRTYHSKKGGPRPIGVSHEYGKYIVSEATDVPNHFILWYTIPKRKSGEHRDLYELMAEPNDKNTGRELPDHVAFRTDEYVGATDNGFLHFKPALARDFVRDLRTDLKP